MSTANNLAWQLATGPAHLRDPAKAVSLARLAVEQLPGQWTYHNTLGVALYRDGKPAEAVKYLEESLAHTAADSAAYDLYFLAMCQAKLGAAAQAKDCFDRAERWRRAAKLSPREVEELDAFRAEAAALVSLDG